MARKNDDFLRKRWVSERTSTSSRTHHSSESCRRISRTIDQGFLLQNSPIIISNNSRSGLLLSNRGFRNSSWHEKFIDHLKRRDSLSVTVKLTTLLTKYSVLFKMKGTGYTYLSNGTKSSQSSREIFIIVSKLDWKKFMNFNMKSQHKDLLVSVHLTVVVRRQKRHYFIVVYTQQPTYSYIYPDGPEVKKINEKHFINNSKHNTS